MLGVVSGLRAWGLRRICGFDFVFLMWWDGGCGFELWGGWAGVGGVVVAGPVKRIEGGGDMGVWRWLVWCVLGRLGDWFFGGGVWSDGEVGRCGGVRGENGGEGVVKWRLGFGLWVVGLVFEVWLDGVKGWVVGDRWFGRGGLWWS